MLVESVVFRLSLIPLLVILPRNKELPIESKDVLPKFIGKPFKINFPTEKVFVLSAVSVTIIRNFL